jgi:hypothetical protein
MWEEGGAQVVATHIAKRSNGRKSRNKKTGENRRDEDQSDQKKRKKRKEKERNPYLEMQSFSPYSIFRHLSYWCLCITSLIDSGSKKSGDDKKLPPTPTLDLPKTTGVELPDGAETIQLTVYLSLSLCVSVCVCVLGVAQVPDPCCRRPKGIKIIPPR